MYALVALLSASVFFFLKTYLPESFTITDAAVQREIPLTIELNGYAFPALTTRPTVEQALAQLQIDFDADSWVYPPLSAPILPHQYITVQKKLPVAIVADGTILYLRSLGPTIGDALQEHGVALNPEDIISPALTTPLTLGMEIRIERVTAEEDVRTESIPFTTTTENSSDLYIGDRRVVQQGKKGVKQIRIKKTYTDGTLTGEEVISEEITEQPVAEVIQVGTQPPPTPPATPPPATGGTQTGIASWYYSPFGEMSAASRDYPKGTRLRVTSQTTGTSIVVTVHDYGPQTPNRIIDLSFEAFSALGVSPWAGLTHVSVEPV